MISSPAAICNVLLEGSWVERQCGNCCILSEILYNPLYIYTSSLLFIFSFTHPSAVFSPPVPPLVPLFGHVIFSTMHFPSPRYLLLAFSSLFILQFYPHLHFPVVYLTTLPVNQTMSGLTAKIYYSTGLDRPSEGSRRFRIP